MLVCPIGSCDTALSISEMRAVLTFHSVDDKDGVLSCKIDTFRQILETLKLKGIPVLTLDELLTTDVQKGVAITFDDGMRSVYLNALPLLREYQVPSHLFLTTALLDSEDYWPDSEQGVGSYRMLCRAQIAELAASGCQIESHTHTHPDLAKAAVELLHEECEKADLIIESLTGRKPSYFAYPFGRHRQETRSYVRDRYRGALSTELAYLGHHQMWTVPRIDSYYLESGFVRGNLDSVTVRTYMKLRSLARTAVGSHTLPNA